MNKNIRHRVTSCTPITFQTHSHNCRRYGLPVFFFWSFLQFPCWGKLPKCLNSISLLWWKWRWWRGIKMPQKTTQTCWPTRGICFHFFNIVFKAVLLRFAQMMLDVSPGLFAGDFKQLVQWKHQGGTLREICGEACWSTFIQTSFCKPVIVCEHIQS